MNLKSIALVGAPNSGKTTLYNWLTGSRFKTVNYPGATVEFSVGLLASHHGESGIQVLDTPGTYSLHPKSADEWVTLKALYKNPQVEKMDGVLAVIDGTNLSRHLQIILMTGLGLKLVFHMWIILFQLLLEFLQDSKI